MPHWRRHARIDGPIVMIGFGSIGKGTLPLIERHFDYDKDRFVVIDPDGSDRKLLDERGIASCTSPITRENYREVLGKLSDRRRAARASASIFRSTRPRSTSCAICREIGALYIDTVVEPWPGFYFDKSRGNASRSNYALRETVLAERRANPGGTTAVSCCGANPGMVSWFVKQALAQSRRRSRRRGARAEDARGLGPARAAARRQGRPYRRARHPARQDARSRGTSSSTPGRSRASSPRACSRPSSAGARTRNGRPPTPASRRKAAARRSISSSPAPTRACARGRRPRRRSSAFSSPTTSRSRSPTITRCATSKGAAIYRPTCHYAYHPCDDAVLSLHEMFGRAGAMQKEHHILGEAEILDGDRRTRRAALRPQAQRLLVRLAAFGRGDARDRALPERHRHAGDLGGARRHGLGAGEPDRPASSKPTRWTSAAASKCRRPISARSSAPIPTGRR